MLFLKSLVYNLCSCWRKETTLSLNPVLDNYNYSDIYSLNILLFFQIYWGVLLKFSVHFLTPLFYTYVLTFLKFTSMEGKIQGKCNLMFPSHVIPSEKKNILVDKRQIGNSVDSPWTRRRKSQFFPTCYFILETSMLDCQVAILKEDSFLTTSTIFF